jgi:hypothetical protein
MTTNSRPAATAILRRAIYARSAIRTDLLVAAGLIGLDVAARLLPHAPNFTPVAASALFAASVLRFRALAVLIPVAGLLLGDAVHGFYDWRVMATVYGALSLPACAGCLCSRLRGARVIAPVMLSCSLLFFLLTNFAVWAFGSMYAPNFGGLIASYVAGLPFLKYTIAGDLTWAAILFGSYWLTHSVLGSRRGEFALVG